MRNIWAGAASFTVILVLGGAAFAQGAPMQPTTVNQYTAPDVSDEDVPVVAPGDEISIACDALAYSAPAEDVRVVLTVSAAPTDADMGYRKVLATGEKLLQGAVTVTIPNVPDLENHTVDLNVYVVNATGSQACNAGHVRIADGLTLQPAPKGKHS